MNCYCYYQEIGLGYPDKMIQRWKASFEKQGFSAKVVGLKEAKQHPEYDKLSQIIATLPTVNGTGFDAACFMRWLAFETVAPGLFVDYDMINYSLTPDQVPTGDLVNLTAMCIYATKKGLSEFIENIKQAHLYVYNYPNGPHISDIDLLMRTHTGFAYTLCDCSGLPSEMTKPVVHFGNAHVKPEWRSNNRWLAMDELTQRRIMFEQDTPKDEYIKCWSSGYVENVSYYPAGTESLVSRECLLPFADKDKHALEIGCGGGLWTLKYLKPNFKSVTCLDVIPEPTTFSAEGVSYIQVPDKNFECYGVRDSSIDFVWSFGVFCHLSGNACQCYLKNVRRVLKPNGQAVIMFGNWVRHNDIQPRPEEFSNVREHGLCSWFYCDHILAERWCHQAGLLFKDMLPTFRDTIAYLKPDPAALKLNA